MDRYPSLAIRVGAPKLTAKGSKRVKPGDGNKTSAKTVKAYETKAMAMKKDLKKGMIDPAKLNDIKRFRKQKEA